MLVRSSILSCKDADDEQWFELSAACWQMLQYSRKDPPIDVQAKQENQKAIEDLIVRVRADIVYLADELHYQAHC